jgi:hypothetical protein
MSHLPRDILIGGLIGEDSKGKESYSRSNRCPTENKKCKKNYNSKREDLEEEDQREDERNVIL